MNRHLSLLFFVSLAVFLVKSESTIEVDENGDEYEVKRFNIQGRQLHERRSQCVEIRRKRAAQSQPPPLYLDNGANDEIENTDDDRPDAINGDDEPAMIFYSPPVISSAPSAENDYGEEEEVQITTNEMNKREPDDISLNYMKVKNNTKNEQNKEVDGNEEVDDDTIEVIPLPQLPILEKLQSAYASMTALASASNVKEATNSDDIIVVQAYKPPKVNTQTHAVFELIPIEDGTDYEEENENDGDNNTNDSYNDDDEKLIRVHKVNISNKRNETSYKKKPAKHRNKYNNSLKVGLRNRNNNQNKNKYRLNETSVNTPIKTRHILPYKTQAISSGYKNRRYYTNKNWLALNTVLDKHKIPDNNLFNNRHRYYNKRNRLIVIRTKNKKPTEKPVKPVKPTFTSTYTWTGTYDDADNDYRDGTINCIIIRKEAPIPTTARPFWQFWSHKTNGARQASDHFGRRKRANLRFYA